MFDWKPPRGLGQARNRLLHQQQVARALDDFGDVALLESGEAGDAARQDFTRVGNVAGKDLNVGVRELKRVLVALFLGCHKRSKEGACIFLGKKKVELERRFFQPCGRRAMGLSSGRAFANFPPNFPSMKKFRDLPTTTQWAAYALAGLTLFLIWDQHYWWKLQDEYAFGFIVPLFVAYVLFDRWPKISRGFIGDAETAGAQPPGGQDRSAAVAVDKGLAIVAGLMVAGGFLAFLAGSLYRAMEGMNLISSNFMAFGYGNILLGGAYLYAGRRADGGANSLAQRWHVAMLFLFPALIWMLSVPMFSAVHKTISTFLMNKVAIVVYHSFDLLGYAVVREGSVLKLPLGDVGVEDACSGIRSLTACLFAGSFLGAVYFDKFWKKLFLVGTAMLFAFFNNILRSLFLTAWAYAKGPTGLDSHVVIWGMDLGNVHDFTGWVVLGLTVICLLILVKIFSIQLEYKIPPENRNP
jgi:exosortase